jgi:hypothetical protein
MAKSTTADGYLRVGRRGDRDGDAPPERQQKLDKREKREWKGLRRFLGGLAGGCLCAGAIAIQAGGAIPKSDPCWGTCGGDSGPVHGYFQTAGRKVIGFEDEQKCLGKEQDGLGDVLAISKSLAVSSTGAFTFKGEASAYINAVKTPVPVSLTGHFTTLASASISLTITYSGCTKPVELVIKAD